MRHFLDLAELSSNEVQALLAMARFLEREPIADSLAGKTVGLVFMNPSLRTLASMQAAVTQLGGHWFLIQPGAGSWALETRQGVVMDGDKAEHVREAVPVLGGYADLLAVRCFARGVDLDEDLADPVIRGFAGNSPVPVVNLESALSHPCQALADWKTLDDLGVPGAGGRLVLSWAWHPKPLPYAVPASTLSMAAMRGMHVTVLRPEGYGLPQPVMDKARKLARESGGTVEETSDRVQAMEGAHVLYAKSWAAPSTYGDPGARAPDDLRRWLVAEDWFGPAADEARFMHCLPVRRNVVVTDQVIDGPRSVVIKQAWNRLHVQKAVMEALLGRREKRESE